MSVKIFRPDAFAFKLPNIRLNEISPEDIYLLKDNNQIVDMDISVDSQKNVIYLKPLQLYEEFADYRIVFSENLLLISGKPLQKNYFLSFRIKAGNIYSHKKHIDPNSISNSDEEYYSKKNIMQDAVIIDISPYTMGELDVDMRKPTMSKPAVENISWDNAETLL